MRRIECDPLLFLSAEWAVTELPWGRDDENEDPISLRKFYACWESLSRLSVFRFVLDVISACGLQLASSNTE